MHHPADQNILLYLGNFLSEKGLPRQTCEEIVTRLNDRDWRVIRASNIKNPAGRLVHMLWTVWRYHKHFHAGVIDVFSGAGFIWAELTSRLVKHYNRPLMLMLHGGGLPEFAAKYPGRVNRLFSRADRLIAPSAYLQSRLQRWHDDIELLPNGIDTRNYEVQIRKRPNPTLIWLRSLCTIYNPTLAVRVLAELTDPYPDSELTMIGKDTDGSQKEVKMLAQQLGVEHRLNCPGGIPKNEVPGWLAKGDIFINTTNVDNAPVSVIEAMASGLCIVSTDVGGIPYLLDHEKDALLVPAGDAKAMAAAIVRILSEPDLAERLSRNAVKKATRFDWNHVIPPLEAALNLLIRDDK